MRVSAPSEFFLMIMMASSYRSEHARARMPIDVALEPRGRAVVQQESAGGSGNAQASRRGYTMLPLLRRRRRAAAPAEAFTQALQEHVEHRHEWNGQERG